MVKTCCHTPNTATSSCTIAPSEPEIYKAVGDWLKTVLPTGFHIRQGQQNRTPQPHGPNCTMVLVTKRRLATNGSEYSVDRRTIVEMSEVSMQINLFGVGSGDGVHRIIAFWRDSYTTDFMHEKGNIIAPLYASDPHQIPFNTAEKQYEDAWTVDLKMQVNFTVTIPNTTANRVRIETIEADTPSS